MHNKRHSLTGRLVLSISLMLTFLWALAVGFGLLVMREEFDEVFDSALQETTERLVPLVVDDYLRRNDQGAPQRIGDAISSVKDEYLTYQVRDASGRVLLHSHNVAPEPYPAPLVAGFWSGGDHRIFTVATISESLFVQVADSLEHRREATMEGAMALLIPLLFILPLGMLATWWIVRRGMQPIDALRDAISQRDGANLAPIGLPELPNELAPIPFSINHLLRRLQSALQAERDLSANSAHELRTPLAGALAQAELLHDQLVRKNDKARADQVMVALRRLSLMLEKLLQLSRAEAGIGAAQSSVDLFWLLEVVLEDFTRTHPSAEIHVQRDASALPLLRRVDPDAFAIAFKNLLENALRYGVPERTIQIHLAEGGNLTVTNLTRHSLEADVNVYRTRFKRGRSAEPGSGLGLAIVDRLMLQMNGSLELRAAQTGDGETVFEAVLRFPDAEKAKSPAAKASSGR
ncbi:MAG: histidine kinase dimerization/phospho-acceptor domain-containing protein [Pseudorhizobium sp.]